MKEVIVAGHICLDITPVIPEQKITSIGELLVPSKLIKIGAASVHTGGAVANTGLAMKKFGMDVSLVAKIGSDAFGEMVQRILSDENHGKGIGDGLLVSSEESTSYTVVVAVPNFDRIFLHNSGANDSFTADDVSEETLRDAKLFHFGYPPVMKKMYEQNGYELVKLFKKVKAAGVVTSLDLSSVDANSEAGQADWEHILKQVLPYVDIFVPSLEELLFMLNRDRLDALNKSGTQEITEAVEIEKDIKPIADFCLGLGVKTMLVKCGARGIYYRTASKERLLELAKNLGIDQENWCDQEGFELSYVPEKVLSATGAGDTSIAAFLSAAMKQYPFLDCMKLATATGASCVEAYDALSGLKPLEELKQKIDMGWKKRTGE